MQSSLTHRQIELRAYQLWEQRSCPWGTPDKDWLRAEHELSNVEPENPLAATARHIGSAIGTVVSILRPQRNRISQNQPDKL